MNPQWTLAAQSSTSVGSGISLTVPSAGIFDVDVADGFGCTVSAVTQSNGTTPLKSGLNSVKLAVGDAILVQLTSDSSSYGSASINKHGSSQSFGLSVSNESWSAQLFINYGTILIVPVNVSSSNMNTMEIVFNGNKNPVPITNGNNNGTQIDQGAFLYLIFSGSSATSSAQLPWYFDKPD